MRSRRALALTAALAVLDVAFFVVLAAVCDRSRLGAALVPVYVVAAAVFVARVAHYYRFAESVRIYRYYAVVDELPLPVGESRPTLVAALYSSLVVVVELVVDVPLDATPHRALVAVWALCTTGNLVHASLHDDRAALRRTIASIVDRRRQRRRRRQATAIRPRAPIIDDTDEVLEVVPLTDTEAPDVQYATTLDEDDDDDDDESSDEQLFESHSQYNRVIARPRRHEDK